MTPNETCAITMDPLATPIDDPNDSINKNNISNGKHSAIAKGLGVSLAFGVMGGLILGPVLGLVLAGSALYTSTHEDKYGESVRYCGNSVCELFDKSIDTCRKCNVDEIMPPKQRKQVSETISAASEHAIKQLQDLDAKFGVTSRASKWIGLKQHESTTLPIANTNDTNASISKYPVPTNLCGTTQVTTPPATNYNTLEYENESKV